MVKYACAFIIKEIFWINNEKNWADWGGCYLQRPKTQVDNTLRDLLNSSYSTKAKFIDCFFIHSRYFLVKNVAKTCLPASTLSLSSIVYVLSSSANIIQIADVALRVVFLLFLLYFLAIISPSSSCSSCSWNEWSVRHFIFHNENNSTSSPGLLG